MLAPCRASTPTLAFPAFFLKNEAGNAVLHLIELSDQFDVTLESSKTNWFSRGSRRRPKVMQSNKDHVIYSDFFSSRRKFKPEGYHDVCGQYVALSCCLSATQMEKSKQCRLLLNSVLLEPRSLAQSESASPKATTLYLYNMSLFIVVCLLHRWQRASSAGSSLIASY